MGQVLSKPLVIRGTEQDVVYEEDTINGREWFNGLSELEKQLFREFVAIQPNLVDKVNKRLENDHSGWLKEWDSVCAYVIYKRSQR